MGWNDKPVDVDSWLQGYARRRYGNSSPLLSKAWAVLKRSAYLYHWAGNLRSIMNVAPRFGLTYYTAPNTTGILEAWQLLYQAGVTKEVDTTLGTYQYDLVDIGRQCLVNLFYDMYTMFVLAYNSVLNDKSIADPDKVNIVRPIAAGMIQLMAYSDIYLGTNVNFLFGNWLNDAVNTSPSPAAVPNFIFNAINQVTMWGPDANINDYACKDWSGLVSGYYMQRWDLFLNYVLTQLAKGEPVITSDYDTKLLALEQKFNQLRTNHFPTEPQGDPVLTTKMLLELYVSPELIATSFTAQEDTDVEGCNIFGGSGPWTKNIYQVAFLCSVNPLCLGFTSAGQLKNAKNTTQVKSSVFYLKKQG